MKKKKRRKPVNIGNTDANADWIKTPENIASETRIHDGLAKKSSGKKPRNRESGD